MQGSLLELEEGDLKSQDLNEHVDKKLQHGFDR